MYNITLRESRGVTGIDWRQVFEDVDEFVHKRLALDAEQKVFEIFVREVHSPARVPPELNCRNVLFFFAHKMLDSDID